MAARDIVDEAAIEVAGIDYVGSPTAEELAEAMREKGLPAHPDPVGLPLSTKGCLT